MYKLLQEKKEKVNNKEGGKDETMAEKLYTGIVYTEKLHYKNNEGGGQGTMDIYIPSQNNKMKS